MEPLNESDIMRRAVMAHLKAGAGLTNVQQPSTDSRVEIIDGLAYAVLRAAGGILAVYRVRQDGKLKGLKRWPVALAAQQ